MNQTLSSLIVVAIILLNYSFTLISAQDADDYKARLPSRFGKRFQDPYRCLKLCRQGKDGTFKIPSTSDFIKDDPLIRFDYE